jgi:IclR family acetate operon transcriptional repressor
LPKSEATEQRPAFQVLERTFSILEVFTEARPEWSTTEIARSLDLPVPSVHRILAALRRLGYVSQHEDTRRFRLGAAALSLGERARAVADLRPVALGPLRRLSDATERDRGVCLERVETPQPLRLSVQPGRQLPLHAGASQKALLAFMHEDEIEALIAGPLDRFCQSTITDPRALRRELKTIRARGWASSYEETNVGVWGIAVPVLSDSDVVCAVGIAGPSPRRAIGLTAPQVSADDATIGPMGERERSAR